MGRAVLAVAVVAAVVLVTGMLAQLSTPFIRRDDWPFLVPSDTPGAADPLTKVRQEGRWLNYAWWLVIGWHATPAVASVIFFTAYAVFVVGLWRLFALRSRVTGGLLLAALLVSPLWVRLSYWPGSLVASAVVTASAVWLLPWASRRRTTLVGWMVVTTMLGVLTYPPVAALALVAAAIHQRREPWRELVVVVVGFLAGFAAGTLVAFTLNAWAFGRFGVEIATWRNPNPVASPHDLLVNGKRLVRQLVVLSLTLGPAAAVGVAAGILGLLDERVRPALLRVAAAVVVVAGLECLQTVVTGVRVNVRGSLWAWLALVVPAGLLLAGSQWSRRAGAAALVALTVLGVQAWRWDLGVHQDTRANYDAIVSAAVATRGADPGWEVVFHQDPEHRRTARGQITEGTLRMMFHDQAGIVVRWCRGEECAQLERLGTQGAVHDLGEVTGVVVPPPPAVL